MNTPICDFIRRYAQSGALRLHMPGHKGNSLLGCEQLDITEIPGADSLYEASGIIKESEDNASTLFGCPTFYSTEGSSQCIRAMVYLAVLHAKRQGKRPLIAAARNAHKTFLSAAALLGVDVMWLYSQNPESYLACRLTADELASALANAPEKPTAVYLTSPDYLGNVAQIAEIAEVCHRSNVLLLVDNAHGAYLKYLSPSQHPIDLGADMCCDSAHKTLPVLTGGAYLHVASDTGLAEQAKNAMALFGSTSPSYLILQSLDAVNAYLATDYSEKLANFCTELQRFKGRLTAHGYHLLGDEPLKITVSTKPYGYEGSRFSELLALKGIICEFSDPDFVVLMLTPDMPGDTLPQLESALLSIPMLPPVHTHAPDYQRCDRILSIRDAMLSPSRTLPASQCAGKILSDASVGCPPAVPIVVCGERISDSAVACFTYYGITHCRVVSESSDWYQLSPETARF